MEFPEDDEIEDKWENALEKLRALSPTPKRLREIRRRWRSYDIHKNWKILLFELNDYTGGLPNINDINDSELEPFNPDKLRLICIDFIS